jgi:hypothetical protein
MVCIRGDTLSPSYIHRASDRFFKLLINVSSMGKGILILLIVLVSVLQIETRTDVLMKRRKRNFKVTDGVKVDNDIFKNKPYSDLKDLMADKLVDKISIIEIDGDDKPIPRKPTKNLIVGDAGGSGTRLYIGLKDQVKAIQIILKVTLDGNENKDLSEFMKKISDILKSDIFVGSTAGMRVTMEKANIAGFLQKAFCTGIDKCKALIMPGYWEGYLGHLDGTLDVENPKSLNPLEDCYLEIGSTSSQIAGYVDSSNKVWSHSGVRLGFKLSPTIGDKCDSDVVRANKMKEDEFIKQCKDAVENDKDIWDDKITECSKNQPKFKCKRLLVRGFNADNGIFSALYATATGKAEIANKCITAKVKFSENKNCGMSFALNKWFNFFKDIGLLDLFKDNKNIVGVGTKAGIGMEWAWGAYKLLNAGFDFSKINEYALVDKKAKSDCDFVL